MEKQCVKELQQPSHVIRRSYVSWFNPLYLLSFLQCGNCRVSLFTQLLHVHVNVHGCIFSILFNPLCQDHPLYCGGVLVVQGLMTPPNESIPASLFSDHKSKESFWNRLNKRENHLTRTKLPKYMFYRIMLNRLDLYVFLHRQI